MKKICIVFALFILVIFVSGCAQSDTSKVQNDMIKDTQSNIDKINENRNINNIEIAAVYRNYKNNNTVVAIKYRGKNPLMVKEVRLYINGNIVENINAKAYGDEPFDDRNGCNVELKTAYSCELETSIIFPEKGKTQQIKVVINGIPLEYSCVASDKTC